MTYHEDPPPAALSPWLACLWSRADGGGPPVRVVPDGCIDVVWTEGRGMHLVGANTTAFLVELPAHTRVLGARFRPGAAPGLLGVDAEGLRDARIPLGEAWGDDGRRLSDALDGAGGDPAALLAALGERARAAASPDPLVGAVVARLQDPRASVAALADDLGLSERQLRRRVRAAVGYGPKRLARVLRLQRALGAARAGDDLARAALDAGYADQAHFANDCRALAGVPPSVLCKTPATAAATMAA